MPAPPHDAHPVQLVPAHCPPSMPMANGWPPSRPGSPSLSGPLPARSPSPFPPGFRSFGSPPDPWQVESPPSARSPMRASRAAASERRSRALSSSASARSSRFVSSCARAMSCSALRASSNSSAAADLSSLASASAAAASAAESCGWPSMAAASPFRSAAMRRVSVEPSAAWPAREARRPTSSEAVRRSPRRRARSRRDVLADPSGDRAPSVRPVVSAIRSRRFFCSATRSDTDARRAMASRAPASLGAESWRCSSAISCAAFSDGSSGVVVAASAASCLRSWSSCRASAPTATRAASRTAAASRCPSRSMSGSSQNAARAAHPKAAAPARGARRRAEAAARGFSRAAWRSASARMRLAKAGSISWAWSAVTRRSSSPWAASRRMAAWRREGKRRA